MRKAVVISFLLFWVSGKTSKNSFSFCYCTMLIADKSTPINESGLMLRRWTAIYKMIAIYKASTMCSSLEQYFTISWHIHCLILSPSETTLERICKYHDVAEYLNISSNRELYLYTIPKKNWKEPLVLSLDFTLISILSVVRKKYSAREALLVILSLKEIQRVGTRKRSFSAVAPPTVALPRSWDLPGSVFAPVL